MKYPEALELKGTVTSILDNILQGNARCLGGYPRSLVYQTDTNDIDIYCLDSYLASDKLSELVALDYWSESGYALTNKLFSFQGPQIQLVEVDDLDTFKIMNDFSFTVCQFSFQGNSVTATHKAIEDMNNKILRMTRPTDKLFILKYKQKFPDFRFIDES